MIFEILKYTLPALIVLGTAYYILKTFLNAQYQTSLLEYRQKIVDQKLPLKLQAYERLMLFCERIDLNNLVLRLRTNDMDVDTLTNSVLISIQKEYEHNMAQQLYISDNLWKILQATKDDTINIVSSFSSKFEGSANALEFANILAAAANTEDISLNTARKAIKEEVKMILQ